MKQVFTYLRQFQYPSVYGALGIRPLFVRTLSSRFLSGFPENGDSQNTAPNMDIDPKTGLLFALRESDCADIRAPLDSQRSLLPFAFTSSSIEVRGPKLGIVSEMQVFCFFREAICLF